MTKDAKTESMQIDKFKRAARELETDDREDVFDHLIKKISQRVPQRDSKVKDTD